MKNYILISIISSIILSSSISLAKQERVAVIDGTPDTDMLYDKSIPMCKPYERVSYREPNVYIKHGTNIALTAMKNVSYNEACLLFYSLDNVAVSIRQAVADGATIINLSVGGSSKVKQDSERLALLYALVRGVKVVISAGNEGLVLTPEICKSKNLIGCYALIPSWNKYLNKNLFYVGHWDKFGTELIEQGSNMFTGMTFVSVSCSREGFYLCGTSQSAAYFTNTLIKKGNKK